MKTAIRILLGGFMVFAGVSHLTSPKSFQAQVPPWFPAPEATILISGILEIALGFSMLFIVKYRMQIGIALALFYLVIFPGNISQYVTQTSQFGLDTDTKRFIRLLFQPVLIGLALWSTGAIPMLASLIKKRKRQN